MNTPILNDNVEQINNFNRRAEQLATLLGKKGCVIMTYDCDGDNKYVSLGCWGLDFDEMLYTLGVGMHHTFVFEEGEQDEAKSS